MLISAVLPIMTLYRLPHGQYGYSGHVINLPQNIASLADRLPRTPAEIDVVVIRKEGAVGYHRDFRVRRSVVLHALQWLTVNNIYYRNVSIDHDVLGLLPVDGHLSGLVTMAVQSDEVEAPAQQVMSPHDTPLASTFIPIPTTGCTEQQTIRQTLQQPCAPPVLPWPSSSGTPINEFTTEGYMSCAFPTLFPTGAADFVAPRPRTVTIGNYFKHLMQYHDGRFAKHPRFRYFALNTEMRHRALQTGRIYVRQNPHDDHLSMDELRDMIGREGEIFSNRVLHYASGLRGTRQYWFKQRSRLIAMVDTLGLPTVFFTHSAADLQWPELARLICPNDTDSSSSRLKALNDNPAIADWFFYHRITKFVEVFYKGVLGATDYWMRFEWQHRGSPHVHGVAWLESAPNVSTILAQIKETTTADGEASTGATSQAPNSADRQPEHELLEFVDRIVYTTNPAILADGSNVADAPLPKTNPHICSKPYSEIEDYQQDLSDLIATCQRHTRCSAAYCLRTSHGVQKCRFGYPKPLQPQTSLMLGDKENDSEDQEPVLLTARNDGLINSFNPVQLSAWRANVDMQYCVSRRKVIEYVTKYATKTEPRSLPLREVYANIVRSLREESTSLKAVQKLLINSVGDRDYSSQETCHLLLQLPMIRSSRDFTILSLDGSRQVQSQIQDDTQATVSSILDHYILRPGSTTFEEMKLFHFAQNYSMPKEAGSEPKRHKAKVVIIRPYCSPDPSGPKYEQYCQYKLMQHVPFRHVEEVKGAFRTFAEAYASFLHSGNIPPSLEDDIHRLEQLQNQTTEDDQDSDAEVSQNSRTMQCIVQIFYLRNQHELV